MKNEELIVALLDDFHVTWHQARDAKEFYSAILIRAMTYRLLAHMVGQDVSHIHGLTTAVDNHETATAIRLLKEWIDL